MTAEDFIASEIRELKQRRRLNVSCISDGGCAVTECVNEAELALKTEQTMFYVCPEHFRRVMRR